MSRHPLYRAIAAAAVCAACLSPAEAWDPIRDVTGKRLDQHAQGIANSLDKWRKKPIEYPLQRVQEIFFEACSFPQKGYWEYLRGQVGQWWALDPRLIAAIQPHYQVDLRGVRFAVDVRTANGKATTFGTQIYFPVKIYYSDPVHLRWLLHELEHTVQYNRRSSDAEFLCEYGAKLVGRSFQDEYMDIERAADRKADFVLPIAWQALHGQSQRQGFGPTQALAVPVSEICRAGPYWQYVPPGPIGSSCYLPVFRVNGVRSFQ